MEVKYRSVAFAVLAIVLMSFVPALVKLNSANEVEIAFFRLVIASLGVLLFLVWTRAGAGLTKWQWISLALLGIVFATHWFLYFKSIKQSTPSIGAITVSTYGIHLAVLSRVFLKQTLQLVDMVALVLAFVGLYVLIPEFNWQSEYFVGALYGVGSGFLYACLPVIHQKNLSIDSTVRTAGQFSFACAAFAPFAIGENWELSASDWFGLLFLAIFSTLLAHSFWVKATSELPGVVSGLVYYLYIPAAIFVSVILVEETINATTLLGALIIVASNVLLIVSKWRHRSKI